MSEVVQRLRDRRLNVWNDARRIAEEAADENRSFIPEEQGRWDALQEELNTLDMRIKAAIDTVKRAEDADRAYEDLAGPARHPGQVFGQGKATGAIRSDIGLLKRNGATAEQVTAILLDTETGDDDGVSFTRGTVRLLGRHGMSDKQVIAILLDNGTEEN